MFAILARMTVSLIDLFYIPDSSSRMGVQLELESLNSNKTLTCSYMVHN